jgi:hypothetical protein
MFKVQSFVNIRILLLRAQSMTPILVLSIETTVVDLKLKMQQLTLKLFEYFVIICAFITIQKLPRMI